MNNSISSPSELEELIKCWGFESTEDEAVKEKLAAARLRAADARQVRLNQLRCSRRRAVVIKSDSVEGFGGYKAYGFKPS